MLLGSYTATMEWVTKIAEGGGNDSPPPFTDEFSYTETGGDSTETSETYSDETSYSTGDETSAEDLTGMEIPQEGGGDSMSTIGYDRFDDSVSTLSEHGGYGEVPPRES